MVGVVAGDDLPQPLPLPGNGLVHPPSQLLLDHPELRLHAVAAGLPIDLEVTSARLATNEGKAQEREGLRLAPSTWGEAWRGRLGRVGGGHDMYRQVPLRRLPLSRRGHQPRRVAVLPLSAQP